MNSVLDISLANNEISLNENHEVTDLINGAVGKIGENIVLRRSDSLIGNIYSYVHNSVCEGMGKIGVILSLDSDNENIPEIGKICVCISLP